MPVSRASSRSWPCSETQKVFVKGLRDRISEASYLSELPEFRSELWIARPSDPELSWHCRRGRSSEAPEPDPGAFHLQKVGFWVPDKIFRVQPYCPVCESNAVVTRVGWVEAPRRVLSLEHHWYLDTMRYHCGTCEKSFLATNPKSIALMPVWVQCRFGLLITHQLALDSTITRFIADHTIDLSEARVAALVNKWHHETFYRREPHYWYVSANIITHVTLLL
jgi:hypothetical protein